MSSILGIDMDQQDTSRCLDMKKVLLILIISSIALPGCLLPTVPSQVFSPDPTPTPRGVPKQVVAVTLPLVERWRWSGVVPGFKFPLLLAVVKERIIVGWDDGEDRKIIALNAQTGELIWQSDYIRNLKSLDVLDNKVYTGNIEQVQAFDLESGRELWQGAKQPPDKKGFLYVYPTAEGLQVYDFNQHRLYQLDSQTGSTLDEVNYPNIFLKKDDIIYAGCTYGHHTPCLRAVQARNSQSLWWWEFGGVVYLWPVFIGDQIMIINAGGQLLGIDVSTGNIIWQSSGLSFLTGPAKQNDLIYAIRIDATIVAFNPETGEEIGQIEMSPNRTVEDDGGYVLHYAIAASDEYLAAYYGTSQELIVFERVDPGQD